MSEARRRAVDTLVRKTPIIKGGPIEQMRSDYAAFMATMVVPDGIATRNVTLAGRRALQVDPVDVEPRGTILFFHGGANALGSPETELGLAASLALGTECRAICPDYRLAPEHPYPAGTDDAFAAYRALLDDGLDAAKIAIAGDSAGGGLVFTTLLQTRDAGLPRPAAAVGFSPGLDFTRSGASMFSKEGIDPMFTRAGMLANAQSYLAGADPAQPMLSPATQADVSNFPPVLLQVGTNELLLDDSTRMAQRLYDAGVDTVLDVTADVPHVFQIFQGQLDEADRALARAALFLRQRLALAVTARSGSPDPAR